MSPISTPRRIIVIYLAINGLFTLGASMIWAINTLFLLRVGGLDLFEAMLANAAFTVAQMAFEVPTGVIADTLGRRTCIVLSMLTLATSTLLYVVTPQQGWGLPGFVAAGVLLGLGYTFQTGSMDAWLVDALHASEWDQSLDSVFAWGQIAIGAGMFGGSLLGGVLGQFDLVLPYLVRAALLFGCFVLALAFVRDIGFQPRRLTFATVHRETAQILSAGVRYGWRSPVVRPLLWTSALSGVFMMFGFYAFQPYLLNLLARDYVWLLGVVQAASSLAGIGGNMLVAPIMRLRGAAARRPSVLVASAVANAAMIFAIGVVGLLAPAAGLLPAAIVIVLWIGWSVVYGIAGPVRMSYINDHIPSAERATVLSLDALFLDAGGAAGQPALGWLSERTSIPVAWLVGSVLVGLTAPLYASSGRASRSLRDETGADGASGSVE